VKERQNTNYFNKALEPLGDSIKVYGAGLKPIGKSFEKHKPIMYNKFEGTSFLYERIFKCRVNIV